MDSIEFYQKNNEFDLNLQKQMSYKQAFPLWRSDIENTFPIWSKKKESKSLIYFLLSAGRVVYVGKTKNGFSRPLSHVGTKDFDEIRVMEVNENSLDELEDEYIRRYEPKYNIQPNFSANISIQEFAKKLSMLGKVEVSEVEAFAIIKASGLRIICFGHKKYIQKLFVDEIMGTLQDNLNCDNLSTGKDFLFNAIDLLENAFDNSVYLCGWRKEM